MVTLSVSAYNIFLGFSRTRIDGFWEIPGDHLI
jgi:hypothetical protein